MQILGGRGNGPGEALSAPPVHHMTPNEAAWLAGLFEGEGNIEFKSQHAVRLTIGMTDHDIVERVQQLVGGSVLYQKPQHVRQKPIWKWRLYKGHEIMAVLVSITPYLGERRAARALDAMMRLNSASERYMPYIAQFAVGES
jgi:hypothetical protein